MHTIEEDVLNVTLIEPRLKHATIFQKFENLEKGEGFTILNDHDPKPLYYQLLGNHGNIFTWKYLEQGPEWYKIRITKKPVQPESRENSASETEVLNVTLLEPRLKHPTIFQKFDALDKGESLIILNDHDPKPVYYQLLGERGNIFSWEYLEQGPDRWKIQITKKLTGEAEETLGEIAAKDIRKAEIFKKYGLDFCCGGKKTVKQACAEKGIDVTRIEYELQHTDKNYAGRPLPYNEWEEGFLADYIVNTHHSYVKKSLPELLQFGLKVAKVHGNLHPELVTIYGLVEEVSEEMTEHMEKEEKILFPFIKKVSQATNKAEVFSNASFGSVENPISMMEHEHEIVGKNLELIRNLSKDFTLPSDACASYNLYFKMLEEFESDLFLHVHLENNILFPRILEMSKEYMS